MNPSATDAFIASCIEFDELIARLQAMREDHFGACPEAVHHGHVGSIATVNAKLRETVAFLDGSAE